MYLLLTVEPEPIRWSCTIITLVRVRVRNRVRLDVLTLDCEAGTNQMVLHHHHIGEVRNRVMLDVLTLDCGARINQMVLHQHYVGESQHRGVLRRLEQFLSGQQFVITALVCRTVSVRRLHSNQR